MSSIIERIGGTGEGLTHDGRAARLAAPGDTLADDGAVIPGPHHATPPCRHFPECGGCQLQHVDDTAYAGFLRDRIVAALAAHGVAAPPIADAYLSPPRTRRRATLHAVRRGRQVLLGFNAGRSHAVVDMHECHVLHPALFALVRPLRGLLATLPGRSGAVGLTLADQGVDMTLATAPIEGLAASEAVTAFAERHRLARLSIDEGHGPEPRWSPGPVTVTLGGKPVALPQGAFLQATADGEAALVAAVCAGVGRAARIADLFAGLGTFALPLAASARVLAVEGGRDAILALKTAAALGRRPVEAAHRDLFRRPLTATELDGFDAVVLDPPRAGAREQAAALAATTRLSRIVYVSCNPATFARDVALLAGAGWWIDSITPVGQFRWTTHVELVATLSRSSPPQP